MKKERLQELAGVQLNEEQSPRDYSLEVTTDSVYVKYKNAVLLDVPTDVWDKLTNEYKAAQRNREGK